MFFNFPTFCNNPLNEPLYKTFSVYNYSSDIKLQLEQTTILSRGKAAAQNQSNSKVTSLAPLSSLSLSLLVSLSTRLYLILCSHHVSDTSKKKPPRSHLRAARLQRAQFYYESGRLCCLTQVAATCPVWLSCMRQVRLRHSEVQILSCGCCLKIAARR